MHQNFPWKYRSWWVCRKKKKCENVIFRGGENPSKMTISWPKKHFFKNWAIFAIPKSSSNSKKKNLRLFFRYIGTTRSHWAVKKCLHAETGQIDINMGKFIFTFFWLPTYFLLEKFNMTIFLLTLLFHPKMITYRPPAIDSSIPGECRKCNYTPKNCMEFLICTLICNNERPVRSLKANF